MTITRASNDIALAISTICCCGHRQVAAPSHRVDQVVDAEVAQQRAHPAAQRAVVEDPEAVRLATRGRCSGRRCGAAAG
jgi:hypothetical protein